MRSPELQAAVEAMDAELKRMDEIHHKLLNQAMAMRELSLDIIETSIEAFKKSHRIRGHLTVSGMEEYWKDQDIEAKEAGHAAS